MKDPYEVLGVTKDASDDEIKAAYRELAKKYHPDKYIDNPLADLAAEKMKEINEAYDKIVNSRKRKSSAKDSSGTYNTSSNPAYARIRSLINNNLLDDAQRELDEIDLNIRDAEWYFLSGSVLYKRGHFSNAYSAFATAVNLEPDNAEYRRGEDHSLHLFLRLSRAFLSHRVKSLLVVFRPCTHRVEALYAELSPLSSLFWVQELSPLWVFFGFFLQL